MLNNIVDNLEQCGQQNIVHCCFHQARTGCAFFAVSCSVNSVSGLRECDISESRSFDINVI